MDFFPDEVILHILSRLPVKYLLRARTVCKRWNCLCLEDYFTGIYNAVSSKNPVVLVELFQLDKSLSGLICVDNARSVSQLSWDFLNDRVKIRATCNGLLCCSSIPDIDVYYVCNPMTRESRLLPKCRERAATRFYPNGEATLVGLACDVVSKKFSVVLAGFHRTFGHRSDGTFVCMIYDSSSNKWRKFISFQDETFTHMNKNQVVFVNGSLHWLTSSCSYVLALDLEYDIWKKISLPDEVTNGICSRVYLLERNGFLSIIQISETWMTIWVLKDYISDYWFVADRVSLRCIKWMMPGIFPISQSSEDVIFCTHKQVLVYHSPARTWKGMYSVKNNSTLPLWLSAHAFKCTITPCTYLN